MQQANHHSLILNIEEATDHFFPENDSGWKYKIFASYHCNLLDTGPNKIIIIIIILSFPWNFDNNYRRLLGATNYEQVKYALVIDTGSSQPCLYLYLYL